MMTIPDDTFKIVCKHMHTIGYIAELYFIAYTFLFYLPYLFIRMYVHCDYDRWILRFIKYYYNI